MVKALTWTPDKLQILGIKKDSPAQSLHSVLSVNEGGVLVNPDILAPVPAALFSLKSHTGGLHLHPAFAFEAVKYYTTAAGALTTVKEGAVTYLGTGVGGDLPFNPVPVALSINSVPADVYIGDHVLITYSYGAVEFVELYYSINSGAYVLVDTYAVAASISFDTSTIALVNGDTLTFKLVDRDNSTVFSVSAPVLMGDAPLVISTNEGDNLISNLGELLVYN